MYYLVSANSLPQPLHLPWTSCLSQIRNWQLPMKKLSSVKQIQAFIT